MSIRFQRESVTARHRTPEGEEVTVDVEVRKDPLTGRTGRVAHFVGFEVAPVSFDELAEMSRPVCPFCPERIRDVTVRFPEDLVPGEGRLTRGEAVMVPNISPYDRYSAVVVVTADHHVPMGRITPSQHADALRVSAELTVRARAASPPAGDHTIVGMNYLPLSGSSLVHPHYHTLVTAHPGAYHEEELTASRRHREATGTAYLEELVQVERGGERWIGGGNHTSWLTAFVSRGVLSEAVGVVHGVHRLEDVHDDALDEFAQGIQSVLAGFDDLGVPGFNLAVVADVPEGADRPVHVRISPRIHAAAYAPVSDVGFPQHLYDESVMVRSPEWLASELRARFGLQA